MTSLFIRSLVLETAAEALSTGYAVAGGGPVPAWPSDASASPAVDFVRNKIVSPLPSSSSPLPAPPAPPPARLTLRCLATSPTLVRVLVYVHDDDGNDDDDDTAGGGGATGARRHPLLGQTLSSAVELPPAGSLPSSAAAAAAAAAAAQHRLQGVWRVRFSVAFARPLLHVPGSVAPHLASLPELLLASSVMPFLLPLDAVAVAASWRGAGSQVHTDRLWGQYLAYGRAGLGVPARPSPFRGALRLFGEGVDRHHAIGGSSPSSASAADAFSDEDVEAGVMSASAVAACATAAGGAGQSAGGRAEAGAGAGAGSGRGRGELGGSGGGPFACHGLVVYRQVLAAHVGRMILDDERKMRIAASMADDRAAAGLYNPELFVPPGGGGGGRPPLALPWSPFDPDPEGHPGRAEGGAIGLGPGVLGPGLRLPTLGELAQAAHVPPGFAPPAGPRLFPPGGGSGGVGWGGGGAGGGGGGGGRFG